MVSNLQNVTITLQNHNTTLFHAYNCVGSVQDFLTDFKEKIKNKINEFELPEAKKRREMNMSQK